MCLSTLRIYLIDACYFVGLFCVRGLLAVLMLTCYNITGICDFFPILCFETWMNLMLGQQLVECALNSDKDLKKRTKPETDNVSMKEKLKMLLKEEKHKKERQVLHTFNL